MSLDPDIKHFLEMPLGGINCGSRLSKPWLPMGKLPTPRRPKVQADSIDENFAPKVSRADLKKREENKRLAVLQDLLAYYAATSVPFDRVATHTGLTIEEATAAMVKRGRSA